MVVVCVMYIPAKGRGFVNLYNVAQFLFPVVVLVSVLHHTMFFLFGVVYAEH
jgi:hypothetical protein